jgi:hypothetical protein
MRARRSCRAVPYGGQRRGILTDEIVLDREDSDSPQSSDSTRLVDRPKVETVEHMHLGDRLLDSQSDTDSRALVISRRHSAKNSK